MAPEEICKLLQAEFGDAVEDAAMSCARPYAQVRSTDWPRVAQFLKDDSRLQLNLLRSITAIDLLAENQLACIYDMQSLSLDKLTSMVTTTSEFAVRVTVDRNAPSIPTVSHLWPSADWHEREAYDMMGIDFPGHPDLRRILCPDDWEGYPLRKDYDFPLEYHGIPATTEYELTNPKH